MYIWSILSSSFFLFRSFLIFSITSSISLIALSVSTAKRSSSFSFCFCNPRFLFFWYSCSNIFSGLLFSSCFCFFFSFHFRFQKNLPLLFHTSDPFAKTNSFSIKKIRVGICFLNEFSTLYDHSYRL